MVARNYLSEITGSKKLTPLDELVKTNGLDSLLPETVRNYLEELDRETDQALHSYDCHLDQAAKKGQENQCRTGKYFADSDKRIFNKYWGIIEFDDGTIKLFGEAKNQIKLPKNRVFPGDDLTPNNTETLVINQNKGKKNNRTFYVKSIKNNRTKEAELNRKNNKDAINGRNGTSIGQRAVLFDDKGRVLRGANAIRDDDLAIELSSLIPRESINDGIVPSKIKRSAKPRETRKHPNKAGIGQTNDLLGGIAALGGVSALIAITACLVPLHFVTSAIVFLTSITTFVTNVNNTVTTYLMVVDGLLAIFGFKGGTKPIRKFLEDMLDNVFGKDNVQKAKELFAKAINSIAVTTKLLERIQSGRAGTDDKIDELAFSLGTVNNALKDSGMIPENSPYMQQSKAIDDFVRERTKDDPDLKENITLMTEEIKDREQTEKLLKEEQEYRNQLRNKANKDINDTLKLIDATKANVDDIREEDL